MAQILKEELRVKILEAAKEEFLEKGYENASLRHIASKADMTVGNLYRYFENKEDLSNKIVEPCLLELEKLLNQQTDNQLSLFKVNKTFYLDKKDMLKAVDNIMDKLIDIYNKYRVEFQILMMDSELSNGLKHWFSNFIKNLIRNKYSLVKYEKELATMSDSYASAILEGFKELLNSDYSNTRMKILCKIYFRSYVYMLNSDIKEMISGIKR